MKEAIRAQLCAQGYQEAITYSFVAPALQALLAPQDKVPVLANPISIEMSVMRASLWPGLIKALIHNLNRQQQRVALFETGKVFIGNDEVERIAGLCARQANFFDVKGAVENLLRLSGPLDAWCFFADQHPALHPGQTARVVRINENSAGWIGALHPLVAEALGIKPNVYVFELDMVMLTNCGVLPQYRPLSRYPAVKRDLAFVAKVKVNNLLELLRRMSGKWLADFTLFDVYQGGIALSLIWQHPSRTLNDEEIEQRVAYLACTAARDLDAVLRRPRGKVACDRFSLIPRPQV